MQSYSQKLCLSPSMTEVEKYNLDSGKTFNNAPTMKVVSYFDPK